MSATSAPGEARRTDPAVAGRKNARRNSSTETALERKFTAPGSGCFWYVALLGNPGSTLRTTRFALSATIPSVLTTGIPGRKDWFVPTGRFGRRRKLNLCTSEDVFLSAWSQA